jgi:hypothetical protein
VIRFVSSLSPYRSDWQNENHINVFGEELMVENTDLAIACKMTHAEIVDYTVAPVFMIDREKGAHEWMIEFKRLQNAFTL